MNERTCSVRGCDRVLQAKGLCHAHYVRKSLGMRVEGKIRAQRPRLSGAEQEGICRLYLAGRPIAWIAADYGVSKGPIQRLLRRAGLR